MTSSTSRRPVRPGLVALGYLLASLVWRFGLELVVGIGIAVWALSAGFPPEQLANILEVLPAWVLAVSSAVQLGGLAALAAFAAWAAGWGVRRSLGLTMPSIAVVIVGFIGVFGSSIFSGWLAEALRDLLPHFELGSLDAINDALLSGSLFSKVLMVATITLAAPLFEELVFRGFLWDAFERAAPWWVAWLLTSFLFAAYHIDPIQAVAVFPIGLYLGWLRHVSGSVWPAIAAHFANNALAAIIVYTVGESSPEAALPIWGALLAGSFTVVAGGVAWLARRPR